jgi:CBS domain-containing protein
VKIREFMQSNVVTIREDTLAKDAYELMRTHRLRHLPVVNRDNQLAGIVSDRDLLNVAVIFKKHPQSREEYHIDDALTARDVMTTEPATVSPDHDLGLALDLILGLAISSLPVIEGGKLVGIITNTDLLRLLKKLSKDL